VNISSGFDGLLKIAHISDIHGCIKYLNGSLSKMINKCDVDYVIITGDLANNKKQFSKVMKEINKFKVNKKVIIIQGNSDTYETVWGKKRPYELNNALLDHVYGEKVKTLINEAEVCELKGHKILIYGFDNSLYGNEKYSEEFELENFNYRILLAHSPNIIKYIDGNYISYDLLLTGHTHGNQINLPYIKKIISQYSNFHIGVKTIEDKIFYISEGLGTTKLPIRINAMPEITVFRIGINDESTRI
jgi:predicted MPP superfamily phosphohydrolase